LYDLFDAYAISERCVKVGRAIFRSKLRPVQIAPHDHARVLMVGNHLGRDIKGANALGLSSVWLDWAPRRAKTPADRTEQPDFTIKTPLDLLDLIDRIERGALLPKETPVPVSFAPTSPDALTLANVAHALSLPGAAHGAAPDQRSGQPRWGRSIHRSWAWHIPS
jgi:hypothetical protein